MEPDEGDRDDKPSRFDGPAVEEVKVAGGDVGGGGATSAGGPEAQAKIEGTPPAPAAKVHPQPCNIVKP
jgi:hypothetical protein